MCSRLECTVSEKKIIKEYGLDENAVRLDHTETRITDMAYIITADEPTVLQQMHFGLVPWDAKSIKMDYPTFNAMKENLLTAKTWHPLFNNHKVCLVITDGFKEGKKATGIYKFKVKGRETYAFAGL